MFVTGVTGSGCSSFCERLACSASATADFCSLLAGGGVGVSPDGAVMLASLLLVAFMYDLLLTRLSDSESSPLSSVNTLDSLSSTEVVLWGLVIL